MSTDEGQTTELDEVTLGRAQRGDGDARRALILCYQGLVFTRLSRMLGPRQEELIGELARQTFLQVFASLQGFAPLGRARLSTWIAAVASRLVDERRPPDSAAEQEPDGGGSVADSGSWIASPPEDFAAATLAESRLVAGDRQESPENAGIRPRLGGSRLTLTAAVVVGAACIGAFVFGLSRSRRLPGAGGEVRAHGRVTRTLGGRGVAVIEAGSDLVWHVDSSGAAKLEQRAGDVFYRVDRGGPFAVDTPLGRVEAVGTCFRIELGAGPSLRVTVYEGRISLVNDFGRSTASAGEVVAVASRGAAPTTTAPR